MSGCTRAGDSAIEAEVTVESTDIQAEKESAFVESLQELRRRGDFGQFIANALEQPISSDRPALAIEQAEALLATGDLSAAQQAALAAAEGEQRLASDPNPTLLALKLWTTARLRLGLPLADESADRLLARLSPDESSTIALGFWRQQLGAQNPYRLVDGQASTIELKRSLAWNGLVSQELDGIAIEINGVEQPLVFLDTGAQQTLISADAATTANVETGPEAAQLVGFVTTSVRPGIVRRLKVGQLVLEDVPVLVGDSASLKAANGQAALGVDLMHHLQLVIDYPNRKLTVAAAGQAIGQPTDEGPAWEIPLWTFSQVCLAQAEVPDGPYARTLVDTGNRIGTFVSTRWLRQSVPKFRRPGPSILPWVKRRKFQLAELELGGRPLKNWPVEDTLPPELERLDAVDVLLGHDLLGKYRVTIDMSGRRLRLVEPIMPVEP